MIDSVIHGFARSSHEEILRYDMAYAEIRGQSSPSVKVCRDLIKLLTEEANIKEDFNDYSLKGEIKNIHVIKDRLDFAEEITEYLYGRDSILDCIEGNLTTELKF